MVGNRSGVGLRGWWERVVSRWQREERLERLVTRRTGGRHRRRRTE